VQVFRARVKKPAAGGVGPDGKQLQRQETGLQAMAEQRVARWVADNESEDEDADLGIDWVRGVEGYLCGDGWLPGWPERRAGGQWLLEDGVADAESEGEEDAELAIVWVRRVAAAPNPALRCSALQPSTLRCAALT